MTKSQLTDKDVLKAIKQPNRTNKQKRWMRIRIYLNGQHWVKRFNSNEEEEKSKWVKCAQVSNWGMSETQKRILKKFSARSMPKVSPDPETDRQKRAQSTQR